MSEKGMLLRHAFFIDVSCCIMILLQTIMILGEYVR